MNKSTNVLSLLILCGLSSYGYGVELRPVVIEIQTEIESPDPQAGMKSKQVVIVDFAAQSIESSFSTGVTSLAGQELQSVRNSFKVSKADFSGNSATLKLTGETASGVLFMPNINYEFEINLTATGKGSLSGCHDGYPSYTVMVDESKAYYYKHPSKALEKLFGTCDQEISTPKPF